MDSQVENAIEIAFNPASDPKLKAQAFDFLNNLKSEPQAWQVCLALATREPRSSEVVRHVALQVVNEAIQSSQLDVQGLSYVKDSLMSYSKKVYGGAGGNLEQDPLTIQNKIAQTLTCLFVALYNTVWPSFFDDIMALTTTDSSLTRSNASGVRLYLKVLISIHDEIADVLVSRSSADRQRDSDLKDLVRQRDSKKIAQTWQEILSQWKTRDGFILGDCLSTIGRWASWIDLSLVVNDTILQSLFELISSPPAAGGNNPTGNVLEVTLNTFIEILGKKMKAGDKIELIEVLRVNEIVSRLIASPPLHELRSTSSYDTDLAECVAKLVNNTVFDIVNVLDSVSNKATVERANIQLTAFLPHVLRFFSDEYDEICSSVIPCLIDLLTYLRKRPNRDADYSSVLPPILQAVIAKMRYDETSSWGNEDAQTDEAEFQELRKRLQVLQQAVASVNQALYIDTISNIISTAFENFLTQRGQVDWRDLDLAMHELFLFGELAMRYGGLYSKTKPVSPAAERLIGLMYSLVESDIASFPHPSVQLQYMETCVRYYTFFEANPQLIPRVLENFVNFVHSTHVKVRTRSWYLFQKFVKNLRQHLGNIAQNVIQAVGDLLPIKAELREENSDDDGMSSDENNQSAHAIFDAQLYLYEAVGCICSVHAVPVESQVSFVRSVMNPLFTDLEVHLGQARSGDERAALQVHHLIMALGTLARGFSDWTFVNLSPPTFVPPSKAISEEFGRTAEAILVALESLNASAEIRIAARFAFSRLISVLGNQVLPQLPRWIDGLLSQTSSKDEMALFLRVLDQVVYGFKLEIFEILNILLTPFLQRLISGISEPTLGTDDEIQLAELKREYLNFLLIIFNNDLGPVLVSEANQPIFETVISTIEHFTRDISDFPTAKLAFSVLSRMTNSWGGPDVPNSSLAVQPSLPGFDRFMIERFSPLCWALPSNSNFNPKDAQGKQVLNEAASLQQAILSKTGQAYLSWLGDVELKGMGMDESTINEYLQALCNLDQKKFRQYFQALVQKSR